MAQVTNEQILAEIQALRSEVKWLREEWENRFRYNWRNADAYNKQTHPHARPQGIYGNGNLPPFGTST